MLITPRIKFNGDSVQCAKWLGFARAKLNALVASMDKANLDQNRATIYPIPGVIIDFSKSFSITRINISVAAGVSEEVQRFYQWYWYAILTGGTLHYIVDLAIDSIQGVWMCGGYSDLGVPGTVYGDNAMVTHHDTDGLFLGAKMVTMQTEFEFANSICIDAENSIYITMDFYSDSHLNPYYDPLIPGYGPEYIEYTDSSLIKFNNLGVVQWSTKIALSLTKTFHTDSNIGVDGDIYTCGWVQDEDLFHSGYPNTFESIRWIGFINKFSTTGTLTWKRVIFYSYTGVNPYNRPDGNVKCERLALDSADNVYSVGLDMGDVNFTNGGGLGFGQGTIFKLNSSGILQWTKQIYTDDPVLVQYDSFWPTDVVIDSEDNVYVLCVHSDRANSMTGYMRYYLVKLNSSGVIQWQRSISSPYSGGEGDYVLNGFPATYPRLAIGSRDEVVMLINAYDLADEVTAALAGEYIITKFDSTGTLIWFRGMDFVDFNVFFGSVKIDQDGDILIGGDLETTLQAFVVKLPGTGAFVGRHMGLQFTAPEVTIGTTGLDIRAADSAGKMLNGIILYSSSTGTYALEDLELTNVTTKILIEEKRSN